MMIEKKPGAINELIYDQTPYNKGEKHIYSNLIRFSGLIKELTNVQATCGYIRFKPFYYHAKLKCQIDFDDYLFYLECRDDFTEEERESHWTQYMDHNHDIPHEVKQYKDMSEAEQKQARILYPICRHGDVQRFHEYLNRYQKYLYDEIIPMLWQEVREKLALNQADAAFGYFYLEVSSDQVNPVIVCKRALFVIYEYGEDVAFIFAVDEYIGVWVLVMDINRKTIIHFLFNGKRQK